MSNHNALTTERPAAISKDVLIAIGMGLVSPDTRELPDDIADSIRATITKTFITGEGFAGQLKQGGVVTEYQDFKDPEPITAAEQEKISLNQVLGQADLVMDSLEDTMPVSRGPGELAMSGEVMRVEEVIIGEKVTAQEFQIDTSGIDQELSDMTPEYDNFAAEQDEQLAVAS